MFKFIDAFLSQCKSALWCPDESAVQTLLLAQKEAKLLGHDKVGPGHLLLGLIGENGGIASKALQDLDIQIRDARAQLGKEMEAPSGGVGKKELPFTPETKQILEAAWENCLQSSGSRILHTEHILLALLKQTDGEAVSVLHNLGVDLNAVEDKVLQFVKKAQGQQ